MSVESSFFELGGNSLRAVSLARRLSSLLGRSVSVADVMRTPTASSLASSADDGKGDPLGLVDRLPAVSRVLDAARLVSSPHVVSWNQSQLLTVHASEGAAAAYNIPMSHWVSSTADLSPCTSERTGRDLDSEAMVRLSVVSVADRHAVLRTTYEASSSSDGADDAFAQHVHHVLGGDDGWCCADESSVWYTEDRASSAASAEGICGRDASQGFALFRTDECRDDRRTADGGCGVLRCVVVRVGAEAASWRSERVVARRERTIVGASR